MASLYDSIEYKGKTYYRKDKELIEKEDVPAATLPLLDLDNVVDENGLIIVDEKNEIARTLTEDNIKSLSADSEDRDTTLDHGETATPTTPDDDTSVPEDPTTPADDDSPIDLGLDNGEGETNTKKDELADVSPDPEPEQEAPTPAPQPARTRRPTEPKFKSKVPQSSPGMGFPRANGKTVDIFDLKTPHTHTKLVGGHAVPLSQNSYKKRSEGEIMARLRELGFEIVDYNALEREKAMAGAAGPVNDDGMLLEDNDQEEDIQLG